MNASARKVFRRLLKGLGFLLLFLVLLLLALRLPVVQTKLANLISSRLFSQTGAKISVDKVAINFIDNVCLKGIYIEDLAGDTLLYAGKLEVDITMNRLLRRTLKIDKLALEKSTIHISQDADGKTNFQFLVDRFAPTEKVKKEPQKAFELLLDKLEIRDLYATTDLQQGYNGAHIASVDIKVRALDFKRNIFDLKKIEIRELNGSSLWSVPEKRERKPAKPIVGYPLKNLKILVKCDRLLIDKSNVNYEMGPPQLTDHFNARYLHGKDLNIDIRDIVLDSSQVTASIRNIGLSLNDQVTLSSFSTDAVFTATRSAVDDLKLKFNDTEVELSAGTDYRDFSELVQLSASTEAKLDIPELAVDGKDIEYFLPGLGKDPTLASLLDGKIELHAAIDGSLENADVKTLHANAGDFELQASGLFKGVTDPMRMSVANGNINVEAPMKALRELLGEKVITREMDRFGKVAVNTAFSGQLSQLNIDKLVVNTQGLLQLNISGLVNNLPKTDQLAYDLKINQLRTGYSDALVFVDSLPAILSRLDTIRYSGTVKGDLYSYDLNGAFATPMGELMTDLQMEFNKSFSNATYVGELGLNDFDAGKLLGIDSLGTITMTTTVDGSGLSLDSLNTMLNTHVMALRYSGYLYEHMALNGRFESKQFEGDIIMRDERVSFDFSGLVNFNDSIPDMHFTAKLDTLDLYALNLLPDPFRLKGIVEADLQGIKLDDMEGTVLIRSLKMENNKSKWSADSISFVASTTPMGLRSITLRSPIANGEVSGRFALNEMVGMVTRFGEQYFTLPRYLEDSTAGTLRIGDPYADQHIELSLSLNNPVALTEFFGLGLTKLDTAYLHFLINRTSNEAELDLFIPSVRYGSISGDSIIVQADNPNDALTLSFSAKTVQLAEGVYVPNIYGSLDFADQKARTSLVMKDAEGKSSLELNTLLTSRDDRLLLDFEKPFILNDREWNLISDGPFTFFKNRAEYPQLVLQSGNQAIQVSGNERQIGLELLNFDINNLTELVEFGNLSIGGTMFGQLDIGLVKDLPLVVGDLDILSIYIDEKPIGDLALTASSSGNNAEAKIQLSGFENDIAVEANYQLDTRKLYGKVDIGRLYVSPFEPFFNNFATQTTGYLKGELEVKGTTNKPELEGELDIYNMSAFILAAQTKYTIKEGFIRFNNDKIRPRIVLMDEEGREAEIKGKLSHTYFTDYVFDLKLSSDAFTFLNSERVDEALYYGKLVARINANVEGPLAMPKVRASVTTLEGSNITVQLLSKQAVLRNEEYIVFYDGKSNYTYEQLDSIAIARYSVTSGIDLTLNVNIGEESLLRLIIDPLTGDNLELRGSGGLVVRIPDNGDLSITGTYTVEDGNYRFSYQKLLQRNFGIEQGSRIIFTGNPMNARLDIRAMYETEASTAALLEGDPGALSNTDTRSLSKKSPLAVVLNIGGRLAAPDLSFSIKLLGDDQSPIGGSVERALARLQQDENQLNQQVFSLLLFNSFTAATASGNISTAGASTALRSVGNLISNQLNRLAGKAEGFEIDFDLDQYADVMSETGSDITEIDLGISQSLLNDKLIISVGGNIGLESGDPNSQAFSNIAGDFVLEYKISQGGKYRVKVFQKTDYDALNDNNLWKTGVGFSYQTKFGRLIFKNQKKLEKKKLEAAEQK